MSIVSPSNTSNAEASAFGLVMGSHPARNFACHGGVVTLYKRTRARTAELAAAHRTESKFARARSPLLDPGITPGGSRESHPVLCPLLEDVAAEVGRPKSDPLAAAGSRRGRR
jgi:6-phosphogluconate dehydrogenase